MCPGPLKYSRGHLRLNEMADSSGAVGRKWQQLSSAFRSRLSIDERRLLRKRAPRTTLEKLGDDCLDIRTLHRAGVLRERRITWSPLIWRDVAKISSDRYLIELELQKRSTPQQIRVEWTRCHLGGMRPWLLCPHCQRRVAKPFFGLAGHYCRACVGNPPYASQTKSAQSRLHFEACKLRLRLGGSPLLTEPFPARPHGMHRKTYARLNTGQSD